MKKILYIFPLIDVMVLPSLVFAQVTTSTIQLPSDLTAQIVGQASALLASLSSYMELIIGVLLALVVVEFVIGAIRHRGQ